MTRFLWERSGRFDDALEICEGRLLVVFFETTDFCNARCVMCGSNLMRRRRQIMPMDLFRTAVKQFAAAKGHSVMLSAFGEPLLDPYLIDRIAFIREFATIQNIGFSTNGSLLTSEKYRALAEAGLKNLSISIDGFQRETYEKIRVGLSFDHLEKNMIEVLGVHEALNRPIRITVSSFTSESPKDLTRSRLYNRLVEADIHPGLKWRVDNWGGLISQVKEGLWLMGRPAHRGPCALLCDGSALVFPDGRISPCHCRDLECDIYIGNIQEDSLLEIWRGELLEDFRREQRIGRFRAPCASCSAYITLRQWFSRSMVRWIRSYNERMPLDERWNSTVGSGHGGDVLEKMGKGSKAGEEIPLEARS
jgi:radical SAM protein with 4Fe4S-binding SPASM domain